MDINQILPLLLKGDNNDQKSKILSAMLGGNGTGNNGGGLNRDELLMQMLAGNNGGGNPEMQAIMNLMKMNNNQKTSGPKAEGLQIISNFAPPDILGTMYKMLSAG